MAPKLAKASLANIDPTPEELKQAKEDLAKSDAKKKASVNSSLKNFSKANPDVKISESRGKAREEWMLNFLVHQIRQKETKTSIETSQAKENTKELINDLHWWSRERMDKELGAAKAEHWRVANACPWRPDSLTGSKDPDHIEWGVPMEWERMTEKDPDHIETTWHSMTFNEA